MWLIGAVVCLLAAPWVQLSVSAGNGWPHNALRHHWLMPISCHFRDCKALLVTSLTHVSGAIASVWTIDHYHYHRPVLVCISVNECYLCMQAFPIVCTLCLYLLSLLRLFTMSDQLDESTGCSGSSPFHCSVPFFLIFTVHYGPKIVTLLISLSFLQTLTDFYNI